MSQIFTFLRIKHLTSVSIWRIVLRGSLGWLIEGKSILCDTGSRVHNIHTWIRHTHEASDWVNEVTVYRLDSLVRLALESLTLLKRHFFLWIPILFKLVKFSFQIFSFRNLEICRVWPLYHHFCGIKVLESNSFLWIENWFGNRGSKVNSSFFNTWSKIRFDV